MELTGGVIMFLAQVLCCVLVRHKWLKYAPTLLCACAISMTVLGANMGQMDPKLLMEQTAMVLMSGFAAVLYHAAMILWKHMKGRK